MMSAEQKHDSRGGIGHLCFQKASDGVESFPTICFE